MSNREKNKRVVNNEINKKYLRVRRKFYITPLKRMGSGFFTFLKSKKMTYLEKKKERNLNDP